MDKQEACDYAALLNTCGYDLVAEQGSKGWLVKPRHADHGWSKFENMPRNWQITIEKYRKANGGMDHQTAINHCEAVRARIGAGASDLLRVVPDISTGNEGSYGIESEGLHYWTYDDFPDMWKLMIKTHRQPTEERADTCAPVPDNIQLAFNLMVPMGALSVIVGQLQIDSAQLFRSGDEAYSNQLQQIITCLTSDWLVPVQ